MPIALLDLNSGSCHGAGCSASPSVTRTPPTGTNCLVVTGVSGDGGGGSCTWNGVSLTLAVDYYSKIWYMVNPPMGNYTLQMGSFYYYSYSWQALWLSGVDTVTPVRNSGSALNPGASYNCTGLLIGDYLAASVYCYWYGSGPVLSGTDFTNRCSGSSGYGQASSCGSAPINADGTYVVSNTTGADDWHAWVAMRALPSNIPGILDPTVAPRSRLSRPRRRNPGAYY